MPTQPDYYAVLGVSGTSDDVVIRAAYKALMLKYHPDTNKSLDATVRAAAINEAFAVLGNAERRAAYDASRARASSPPPSPPPPPPSETSKDYPTQPPSRFSDKKPNYFFGASACVIGLFSLAAILDGSEKRSASPTQAELAHATAQRILNTVEEQNNLPARSTAMPYDVMNSDLDLSNSQDYSSQTGRLGTSGYQSPTQLDFRILEDAALTYTRVLQRDGVMGARAWSENCHKKFDAAPSWAGADRCAAFDAAALYVDNAISQSSNTAPNAYFAFQGETQLDRYKVMGGDSYTVGERLKRIRSAVEPVTYNAVMNFSKEREAAEQPAPISQQPYVRIEDRQE